VTNERIGPQPGPQRLFLESSADVAIYGGAAGGGKSFALLLEPLRHVTNNRKFAAVFFRRTTTQITNPGGLWDAASRVYPLIGASPRLGSLEWLWPRGGKVKMAHLEHEQSKNNWQGAELPLICCEENEPIRMTDGSLRPVGELRPGDLVQTLQGPRPVLLVGDRRLEDCVRAEVRDDQGGLAGHQIHSTTHKVLTPDGWVSYADACDQKIFQKSVTSTRCHSPVKLCGLCGCTPQSHAQPDCNRIGYLPLESEPPRSTEDHHVPPEVLDSCACIQPLPLGSMVSHDGREFSRHYTDQSSETSLSPLRRNQDRQPSSEPSLKDPHQSVALEVLGGDLVERVHPSDSMGYRSVRIYAELSGRISQSQERLRDSRLYRSELQQEFSLSPQDHLSESETAFCKASPTQGSGSSTSPCEPQVSSRPSLVHLPVVLAARFLDRIGLPFAEGCGDFLGERACDLIASSPLNSSEHCCISPRLYGEHEGQEIDSSRSDVPLSVYVAGQIQKDWLLDDLGITRRCIHRKARYDHPYTGEERTAEEPVVFGSCAMEPCGKRWVVDITVAGENHYISGTGLANKNCFDELTHFSASQFWYMVSRNRSMSGVRAYVRATCNPDADSWVADFISWWINHETGFPIPERAGVLRWVLRVNDKLHWADNRQDLIEEFTGILPTESLQPKSVTFIAARLTDNKALMEADPGYMANLLALPTVERERLLAGNWRIRPSAGLYFQRTWMKPTLKIPPYTQWARGWDLAATPKTEINNPDFTESVLIGRSPDGSYIVADHTWMQGSPEAVEKQVLRTAKQDAADGRQVVISIPQDPAQAGKAQALAYTKLLSGYNVRTSPESRAAIAAATGVSAKAAKIGRFGPFSAQCEGGNVSYIPGDWNETWFDRLEAFPEAAKDDTADATSRAFSMLAEPLPGQSMLDLATRHSVGQEPKPEAEPRKIIYAPGSVEFAMAMMGKRPDATKEGA
jgi:predicted phage terminase large subunit-like protein